MRHAIMAAAILLITVHFVPAAYARNITFDCEFGTYADPDGLHSESFGFRIMFDDLSATAFVAGNVGMSPVTATLSQLGITFTETTLLGAVMTTTIALDGSAVHSRNTFLIDGPLIPSQHYGICTQS